METSKIINKLKEIQGWNKMALEFHDRVALDYIESIVDDLLDKLESKTTAQRLVEHLDENGTAYYKDIIAKSELDDQNEEVK